MGRSKELAINMLASIVAYGVSLFISFFLSPYIVSTIGVEANGFITLANNFVSYASIITIALNSLAGRYITIALRKKDVEAANRYFTSVYFGNLAVGGFLLICSGVMILFLENIINIPLALVSDIRALFTALFLSCILSVVGAVFSVATFATNKLYLDSIRNIQGNLIRTLIIIGSFAFWKPRVCYVGIASLAAGIYTVLHNIRYTKMLLPEIHIRKKYFDFKSVIELVTSGIWNTVNRLGQLLIDGFDLLIANLLIDATAMGILGLAKTVPGLITGLMSTIVGVFSPNFTILYAEGKKEELLFEIKRSMKIMGILTNLPIIILIVCGQDFFRLWQPTQNAVQLQVLSLLTVGTLIFSGGINCIYTIFTVVNKLKMNSIVVLIGSAVSTIIGIYAIAGVSTIINIIRNLAFTAPYGAYCLEKKWYYFYKDIFVPVLYVLITSGIGLMTCHSIAANNWCVLILKGIVVIVLSISVAYMIVLNKNDRLWVKSLVLKRVNKKIS